MGFHDQTTESFDDSEPLRPRSSRLRPGYAADIRSAADLAANVRFGDEFAAKTRSMIDASIQRKRIDALPAEDDPVESTRARLGHRSPRDLDLCAAGVGTVIWATGSGGNSDWLPDGMRDGVGVPAHTNGIGRAPGLYVLGFPWISKRKSGIIHGLEEDASRIAAHLTARCF
jgi:putative flavoprotein involved in K+ transport